MCALVAFGIFKREKEGQSKRRFKKTVPRAYPQMGTALAFITLA